MNLNLTRAFNVIMIVMLFGAILAMSACSKETPDGQTVGQKVGEKIDTAIDKTNAVAAKAGDKVVDAGQTLKDTGAKIGDKATQVADQAGDALKSANTAAKDQAGQARTVVDDSLITASIKTDLLKDPGLSAFRVDVNTVQGEVTLKGDVDTEAARDRAGRVAMAISGVTKVNNQISVMPKHASREGVRPASDSVDSDGFPLTTARMRMMS